MRVDLDTRTYFDIGDRVDLTYEEKLDRYRHLVDAHFQVGAYEELCAGPLAAVHEQTVEYVESPAFDEVLVDTVKSTFPANEHEAMIARHRGLLGAWASDQHAVESS